MDWVESNQLDNAVRLLEDRFDDPPPSPRVKNAKPSKGGGNAYEQLEREKKLISNG